MGRLGAGLDPDERRKPVGSLFLEAMDRDSIIPYVRRTHQSRLVNRSLPNTPFSLYPDEPGRTRSMSAGGRRHVQDCGSGNPVAPAPPEESHTRRQVPKHAAPHLDNDAQATRAEEVPPRPSRQRCRPPPFEKRAASEPRPRMTATPLRQSHLSLGSLTPAEETPRERPVPPPMVKKPLRSGRRHTPAPRSASVDDRHIGIKMVLPPHHWNSVTERREALMSYGIDAYEPRDVLHRNQSNWSIGYGSSTPKTKTLVNSTEGNGNGSEEKLKLVTSPNKLIQRSRRNSSTPRRREYDIISWMPL